MSRNRVSNLSKTLKDYAVPFVWLLLILVLLYSVFSSPSTKNVDIDSSLSSNNWSPQVDLSSSDTIAYVVYDSWKKVQIEGLVSLWKLEKVVVELWSVVIDFPLVAKMKLSENWEFKYMQDGSFYLESWDLWVESSRDIDISMRYANASLSLWSISNLNQNELESSVYSIFWKVSVSNLASISTELKNGYKLSLKSSLSTSNEIDFDSLKSPIDDYFKLSSWFKNNGWEAILKEQNEEVSSLSWSLLPKKDSASLLSFDDVVDESYVDSNPIILKWRYSPSEVWAITVNGIQASLDKDLAVFSLKWINLPNSTNDLIVKIFDSNKNIISKSILTLYSKNPSVLTSSSVFSSSNLENYPVRPTDFLIYEPTKTWKFTTSSSRVTIRWKVSNKNVASVSVNWYTLKSYNGSTWRYHAFVEQETLKDGANNYEIKYINKAWEIIYKEYYSIYKEVSSATKDSSWTDSSSSSWEKLKETKIMSWEVKLD